MNTLAQRTEIEEVQPRRGEVWQVNTGEGVANCMVISNDVGNKMSKIVTVAMMIKGQKRKPTQMQSGDNVVMFEQIATFSHERLVKKVGKVKGNFNFYLEAVSKSFSRVEKGVQHLHPRRRQPEIEVDQWGFYFIDLGEGIGSEQAGLRLVLVISNPILNGTGKITIAPATTKLKRVMPTHVDVPASVGIPNDSTLLFEQMRTVDIGLFEESMKVCDLPAAYQEKVLDAKSVATAENVRQTLMEINNKKLVKNA